MKHSKIDSKEKPFSISPAGARWLATAKRRTNKRTKTVTSKLKTKRKWTFHAQR